MNRRPFWDRDLTLPLRVLTARRRERQEAVWADRATHCRRCWYDMKGSLLVQCPECGTAWSEPHRFWKDGRFHFGWIALAALVAGAAPVIVFLLPVIVLFKIQWTGFSLDLMFWGWTIPLIVAIPAAWLTGQWAILHTRDVRNAAIRSGLAMSLSVVGYALAIMCLAWWIGPGVVP